jgi:hypothetical protein
MLVYSGESDVGRIRVRNEFKNKGLEENKARIG